MFVLAAEITVTLPLYIVVAIVSTVGGVLTALGIYLAGYFLWEHLTGNCSICHSKDKPHCC